MQAESRADKACIPHLHPPPAAVDRVLRCLEDLRDVVRCPLVPLLQRQLVDAAAKLVRDLQQAKHPVKGLFLECRTYAASSRELSLCTRTML